ncbi:MAG: protein kinase [Candidatus Pacebacteria bacterium]|nr:protein kinase [Candidatus Paceibacterota bacterium]
MFRLLKIALYIQMELCAQTLEEYLNARECTTLSPEDYQERLGIAKQIVEAIHTIHCEHKLIHRDLSLRNVFLGRDGAIKIGDFGLATRCRHLIPQLASPAGPKPMDRVHETPEEDEEDVSSLDLGEGAASDQSQSESQGSSKSSGKSSSEELTHGLGTQTFAAPEQMSNLPYDQKADVYSLGLILLALFSPTETISERYEILRKCRARHGPSLEFSVKYPEMAELIARMTSESPAQRPTIDELKNSELFASEGRGCDWEKMGFADRKSLISIGSAGKCKVKYLKICENNLLVYNKKEDGKAKFCYPLNECKIVTLRNTPVPKASIRRNRSSHQFSETMVATEYAYRVAVEHPQLETLYLFLQTAPLCSPN